MIPSKVCADLIKGYERCRLKAYMPTPNDVPTIGWGATGPDIRMGMVWTQAQADERFAADLARSARGVWNAIDEKETTQNRFDALVSFAFNVGIGNLLSSTLLRKHVGGDYAGAQAQFARWNRQKGKVLNGLTDRRATEAALYGKE